MPDRGDADAVQALYATWPYPSRLAGKALIYDTANLVHVLFPGRSLRELDVLDAGCGSGHRLVALAKRYPEARFTGVDFVAESLGVAEELARHNRVPNVRFVQADLLALDLTETYDLVISTGVVHHLEDPALGAARLCRLLKADGIVVLWLYHSIGEFRRLNQRELVRTLRGDSQGHDVGVRLMRELHLTLDQQQYGSTAVQGAPPKVDRESIDVDAFLHPIVNAFRLNEAVDLLQQAGVDWAAVNGINMPHVSKLIDLDDVEDELKPLCLQLDALLESPLARAALRELDKPDQLRVLELLTEPTGFTVLGGTGRSLDTLGPRIQGNRTFPTGEA